MPQGGGGGGRVASPQLSAIARNHACAKLAARRLGEEAGCTRERDAAGSSGRCSGSRCWARARPSRTAAPRYFAASTRSPSSAPPSAPPSTGAPPSGSAGSIPTSSCGPVLLPLAAAGRPQGAMRDAGRESIPISSPLSRPSLDHALPIEPGRLAGDASGRLLSPDFGDVYRKAAGGLAEAETVFVGGARMRERWTERASFTLLDLGLGIGANFFATLAAWRGDPRRPARLDFVSVEAHPLPAADLDDALGRIGVARADAQRLLAQWPLPLPGLHQAFFDDGRVVLTLAFGDAAAIVPRLALAADAFYLDGFAPSRNPAMWSPALMKQLARRARPGATVASYSVAGSV